MVNIDLLGGIREALERGETLQAAMVSFYNAGYSKDEIEDAARALQMQGPVRTYPSTNEEVKSKTTQRESSYGEQKKEKHPIPSIKKIPKQEIVGYTPKQKTSSKIIVALLIIFLILLLGVIISLVVFKEQLVDLVNNSKFLSNLFGL